MRGLTLKEEFTDLLRTGRGTDIKGIPRTKTMERNAIWNTQLDNLPWDAIREHEQRARTIEYLTNGGVHMGSFPRKPPRASATN